MNIAKTSPLYEYWNSDQHDEDENKRISKINFKEPASYLLKNEPYKWEILYQSVLGKVVMGDEKSMKGLIVLLSTLIKDEKEKTLILLEDLLDKRVIQILRHQNYQDITSNKDPITAISILLNIFLNPYDLEIKREKRHLYEKTGMYFFKIRKLFSFKK